MRHLSQSLHSADSPFFRTFHPTGAGVVGIMWGITALWVIVGSLIPTIARHTTTSLDVTLLLMGPTCCTHIGWIVSSRIESVRIKNAARLDHQLSIEMAFAAGQMTERRLHEEIDQIVGHDRTNVIELDHQRRTTTPTPPPEGWKPSREYGSSHGH